MPQPHFFDAHTHVQFSGYNDDRDAVIRRALDADVWMVNVGTQKDTSRAAVTLAEEYPEGIYAAVGLHPVHTSRSYHDAQELGGGEAATAFTSRGEVFDADYYRALALNPKTVAIGECGLDYFHFNDDEPREVQIKKQKDAFLAQIELSKEVKKPLMIHCRNAFDDLIAFVRPHAHELAPGVIHFFTGTPDDAKALLDLGFCFTFGGAITFPARKGKSQGDYDEVIKLIPIDRILSETDAPYVAPAPYRGQKNEPAYVVHAVAKLAELKGISSDEMKARIWENAERIFKV
ncbi:MAG TPA: TatD family hydrolase [Candidatus Paceibacterota bacterium]|nr:TatD family hydrolase [Candidatus Paceibacterota bacterium]